MSTLLGPGLYTGENVITNQPCDTCMKPGIQFLCMFIYEHHYLRDGMTVHQPGSVFRTEFIVCPECHY